MATLNQRLEINEEFGASITYKFSNKVIEACNSLDTIIASHCNPLGEYDFSKAFFYNSMANYLLEFADQSSGSLNDFRLRDPCDNAATSSIYNSGLGSFTQGVLFPIPNGINKVFYLAKSYSLGVYKAYKPITKPIASTIIVYVNGVSFSVTLNEQTGKVTFNSAPSIGATLTWSGNFDIPVRFQSDTSVGIETKVYASDSNQWMYQLPNLKMIEVKESIPVPVPVFFMPPEVDHLFQLDFSYDSLYQNLYKTSAITLDNNYEKRTKERTELKGLFRLGQAELLNHKQLEYLITLWRVSLGNSVLFKVNNHLKNTVDFFRFNMNQLQIKVEIDSDNRTEQVFSISGIEIIGKGGPAISCATSVNYVDGTFIGWSVRSLKTSGTQSYGSIARSTGGGNPSACMIINTNLVLIPGSVVLYMIALSPTAIYDPSIGAITSINYSEDAKFNAGTGIGSLGHQSGLVAVQDGNIFIGVSTSTGNNTNWNPLAISGLLSGNFAHIGTMTSDVIGATSLALNFGGSPIRFGFFRGTPGVIGSSGEIPQETALDNWNVTLTVDCG